MVNSFKKDSSNIRIINWHWYPINGKRHREGICHVILWYVKANNKYVKDYVNNKESSYLKYWDVNNLYGWTMLQKLPVNKFEWIEDISQFNEDLTKNYTEEGNEG